MEIAKETASAAPPVRLLEAIERDAWLDLFASAPAAWAAGAGLRHERLGAADLLVLKAAPIGQFNRLVRLCVGAPASEGMLAAPPARLPPPRHDRYLLPPPPA